MARNAFGARGMILASAELARVEEIVRSSWMRWYASLLIVSMAVGVGEDTVDDSGSTREEVDDAGRLRYI
jgi:hypothetical protein